MILRILFCLALLCAPLAAQQPIIGFESGPATATGTPANSSHASGTAVGPSGATINPLLVGTQQSGLFVVPWARIPGASGVVTQVLLTSTGGATVKYVVRIWSRLPVNTTCVDNTAFAGNFATDDQYLIAAPFSITPAAPDSTAGDANTYGSSTGLVLGAVPTDPSYVTRNLYVCVVTSATDTADENKPLRVMISGHQN